MHEVPALLRDAAREALDALQQVIGAESRELAGAHLDAFRQYRRDLEAAFLAYSILPDPKPFDPAHSIPLLTRQWNGRAFQQSGRAAETLDAFQGLLDTLRDVDTESFESLLDDAATDGYERALWMLSLGGVEEAADLLDLTPDDWAVTIRDAGFDETDWDTRLTAWTNDTGEKVRRWLTASSVGGLGWDESADLFDGLTRQHTNRITGLFGNEMLRAFNVGALVALGLAERQLGIEVPSIWVCRTTVDGTLDPLVCPICAPLHLTVTTRLPIDHSHPGCRCLKVPLTAGYVPSPIAFTSFVSQEQEEEEP